MKLNVIKTNTTIESSKGLIRQLAKQNDAISRHFFIVPDRFTLSFEQEICEKVFPDGSYNVDVVSFTRLAIKLLGNKINKCLSKEGTVILLNKVILKNNDKLTYYKDLHSYSFSKELFAAIASLRNSKICYDDIESSLSSIEGVTKEKLKDIALLYKAYNEELQQFYADTITRIDSLIDNIKNLPILAESHIYIYGFNIYSEQQIKLIKELMKYCKSVSIAFIVDSGGINHSHFIVHQMEELIEFSKLHNIELEEIESTQVLKSPFSQLHKNLFGYQNKMLEVDKEDLSKVVLYVERNPYEEINAVAREINYLIKEKNYRYKDISIVSCMDTYKNIIEEIFTRCGIPYFMDSKYYVKDTLAVKYINALFNVVSENYSKQGMCKLAHHPLVNLSREQIEIFENYILKYNIDYSRFLHDFELGDCGQANIVRKVLINLVDKVPKGKNEIKTYVDFIKTMLSNENIIDKLYEYSLSEDLRLSASSSINDFIGVVEEISELNGDNIVYIDEFINIYNSAIADMGKGVLPQYIDSVFIGNTTDSRFNDILALFVIGASSGNFPLAVGDNIIISAFDNELMKKNGLKIYPSPLDNNKMERLIVIDLIAKPKEKLYVGYSSADVMGTSMLCGEALNELMYLLGVEKLSTIERSHTFSDSEQLKYLLINEENAYYEYIRHNIPEKYTEAVRTFLIEKGYDDKLMRIEKPNYDNTNFQEFLFKNVDGVYNTSVSQLESYFKCPFYHFCKYGLHLQEREEGYLKVFNIGNIIHEILEYYFKNYVEEIRVSSDEELYKNIDYTINKIMSNPDYDMYRTDSIGNYTLTNISNESRKLLFTLTQYVKKSSFTPTYIEMGFGRNDSDKKIKLETKKFKFNLVGKVDRVDTFKDKISIIDYKTGSADEKFKYIYYGKKIQLYMYMKVFLDEGNVPAGVFYMPIKSSYVKDGVNYKLIGQIANDLETFSQLDNGFDTSDDNDFESDILAFKTKYVKSNKGVKINSKNAIEVKDFYAISDYVMEISKIALDEICEGYFERKPYTGSCEFCSYNNMCGEVDERKDTGASKVGIFYPKKEENDE
jgi:ATP-dependent helicase/nuclease subunit B